MNKENIKNLYDDITYFLHRYYPENRENLTPQDWQLYLALTNILCGRDLSSIRLLFTKEQLSEYKLLRKLIDEIYD